ncbi:hypothetical protein DLAC_08669 [Tieghemostelium lacteum]|uniref:Cytochrome b5 heme-binding domain-containing protein n=1 Tax=Tieghemostelium lacteum TaxID=361077 RepID=A0A151Z824_TIELA|nr:hypothetical protein DLAC_08669 [Tieghemostelium lacteum]|eukprot:KYQ90085.1 hypothetical protein DLAC_08669 [Tieghemostelium lacteum]
MIESNSYIQNNSSNSNNINNSDNLKCNNCCCGKNNSDDIEEIGNNKNKREISNSSSNNERKIIIEQTVQVNKPLSQSLNSISNSLYQLSKSVDDNKALEGGGSNCQRMCTCQQSKNYPYCDSTHEQFNLETKSNLSPLYIKIDNNPINKSTEKINTNINQNRLKPASKIMNKPNTIRSSQSENTKDTNNTIEPKQQQQQLQIKYKPTSIKEIQNQNNYFRLEEIAQHNTVDSCWMIIYNKVYDITSYIPSHPGGKNALLRFAGKDGTENVQFHSNRMLELLNNNYFIGHLAKDQQTVAQSRCIIC